MMSFFYNFLNRQIKLKKVLFAHQCNDSKKLVWSQSSSSILASLLSPWYLRWQESPPAQTWSWSDPIWSHLLRWTRLSAPPALRRLVQKCSAGSRWCRRSPPVYLPLQTEWRETPLLLPNGKEIITVTECIITLNSGRKLDSQGCISPLRLSSHHLCITTLVDFMSVWNWAICWRSWACEIDYYLCWQRYKHAEDRR